MFTDADDFYPINNDLQTSILSAGKQATQPAQSPKDALEDTLIHLPKQAQLNPYLDRGLFKCVDKCGAL